MNPPVGDFHPIDSCSRTMPNGVRSIPSYLAAFAALFFLAISAWGATSEPPHAANTQVIEPKATEPITVRISEPLGTERTEHQTQWELQDSKDKSANDDRMFYVAIAATIIALLQAFFFVSQLLFMRRTIKQADKALEHSRQELKASQRAWVRFEFAIASGNPEDPQAKSPLLINQSGVYLWLKVKLKNFGNAPALSMHTVLHCYAPAGAPLPIEVQREYCEEVKDPKRHVQDIGGVLFPGEEVEFVTRTNLLRSDLDASVAYYSPRFRGLPIQVFELYLVGCIDYKSAIDGSHHQTGFVFQVSATEAKNGTVGLGGLMPLVEEPIPAQDLVLSTWNDSGAFFAD